MTSGDRRIVINNAERAVSTDNNRGTAMAAQQRNDMMRSVMSRVVNGPWANYPGLQAPLDGALPGAGDIVTGDVFSGLLVNVDNAGFLLVGAGAVGFYAPAFPGLTADDTPYITVIAPALVNAALLTFTPNAGPGVRWDIVEVQPVEATTETSSRDIYDPNTGIFTPALVPKVTQAELSYRIRQGTAGSGIPDIDPAWCPLAAILVRTDSTGFNNCDVYDIRPLVNERCDFDAGHPAQVINSGTVREGQRLVMYEAAITPQFNIASLTGTGITGYFRSKFGGYWSGGRIRCNTPVNSLGQFGATNFSGGDADFVNPEIATNQSAGFAQPNDSQWTLGAFFPRGYPRWVRYTENTVIPDANNRLRPSAGLPGRVPSGCRGVLVATPPSGRGNGTILPTSMPVSFGETQQAWGHVVCEGIIDAGGNFLQAVGDGYDDKYSYPAQTNLRSDGVSAAVTGNPIPSLALAVQRDTVGTQTQFSVTLPRAYPIPPYARAVLVRLELQLTLAAPGFVGALRAFVSANISAGSSGPVISVPLNGEAQAPLTTTTQWDFTGSLWVPLIPAPAWDEESVASVVSRLDLVIGSGAPSGSSEDAWVVGYQL